MQHEPQPTLLTCPGGDQPFYPSAVTAVSADAVFESRAQHQLVVLLRPLCASSPVRLDVGDAPLSTVITCPLAGRG